MIVYI